MRKISYPVTASIGAGDITSGMIADDAITAAKIAADAVAASEVAADAIGTSELADNAVDTGAIAAAAVTAAKAAAGFIVQVVTATYSTAATEAAGTFTDTGLTASITPSSTSNKILVIVNHGTCSKSASGNFGVSLQLLRASTVLALFAEAAAYGFTTGAAAYFQGGGCVYLDSPASVAAVTYKTQFKTYATPNTAEVQANSSVSSIVLLEVRA